VEERLFPHGLSATAAENANWALCFVGVQRKAAAEGGGGGGGGGDRWDQETPSQLDQQLLDTKYHFNPMRRLLSAEGAEGAEHWHRVSPLLQAFWQPELAAVTGERGPPTQKAIYTDIAIRNLHLHTSNGAHSHSPHQS
jgi:hypothetical protein